jgi:hypothetical protein
MKGLWLMSEIVLVILIYNRHTPVDHINPLGSHRRRNVFPVRYELGFYIPEDDILHSHRRENFKSYIALTGWTVAGT